MYNHEREIYDATGRMLLELKELESSEESVVDALEQFEEALRRLRAAAILGIEATVKRTMARVLDEEGFGINETQLAEMTAEQLDLQEALDDPQNPIWDWAIDVLQEHEEGDEDDEDEEDE